jgi:hypothetical protein
MTTVFSFDVNGKDMRDPKEVEKLDKLVTARLKDIIDRCKSSQSKFIDPDFGPNESDPYGAKSLYGPAPPVPAGHSKYPSPESLRFINSLLIWFYGTTSLFNNFSLNI